MRCRRWKLSVAVPVLVLFSWSGFAQAFSFCFSFGGRDSQRPHHDAYRQAYTGGLPGVYGGYPYSPVPAYPGYGGYYSLPYGIPGPAPLPETADPERYRK
ncbi:MAG TPA: hypothetical protein VET88_04740 [Gammaproteobacteria bacterium]|nr:hypothetical protein [Gammaproteobacteria bacterium]